LDNTKTEYLEKFQTVWKMLITITYVINIVSCYWIVSNRGFKALFKQLYINVSIIPHEKTDTDYTQQGYWTKKDLREVAAAFKACCYWHCQRHNHAKTPASNWVQS